MEQFILTPNAVLIQGATMKDLESMMDRLLDAKLSNVPTPKTEEHQEDRLYLRREAAKRLHISIPTLIAWTRSGIINARKIGTRIYYTDSDINNALQKVSKE